MRTLLTRIPIALVVLACSWNGAQAGFGVRIGIGIPFPYPYYYGYGPYYRPYYYGYGYPYYGPVVVAAPGPAVVVQSPSAAVPPAPAGASYQAAPPSSPPPTLPSPTPVSAAPPLEATPPNTLAPVVARNTPELAPDAERLMQLLHDPGEGARISAVMQLGRNRALQAVEPITQMLNGDSSPLVRDAAARALGLIASPSSLKALQTAAQADDDREVRHSAQFAAEVIRSNLRR
jgi:hypothetical protein